MEILDCTLRDGGHALSASFSTEDTSTIIQELLTSGIKVIEFGKPSGIGSPKGDVDDRMYLAAVEPLLRSGELGMFCRPDCFGDTQFSLIQEYPLGFLRVGTNASLVEQSKNVIEKIRNAGIKVRYSLVQAHSVTPSVLAQNARKVEGYGAESITIMDSTGTLSPFQVKEYVDALVNTVTVPVGFHGHNNLGYSIANAMAAIEAGASSVDGALGGLARSAGNAPTEILCIIMEKEGIKTGVDFYNLLHFINNELSTMIPEMKNIPPLDIIFGYAGFHSRNLNIAKNVAKDDGVDLFRLIVEVMRYGQANPDEILFKTAAAALK